MRAINQYKFKNKKILEMVWVRAEDHRKNKNIPVVDNLLFHWSCDDGKTFNDGLFLRPDEALLLAKQLLDAVYKVTGIYKESPLRGYYGYTEFDLVKRK